MGGWLEMQWHTGIITALYCIFILKLLLEVHKWSRSFSSFCVGMLFCFSFFEISSQSIGGLLHNALQESPLLGLLGDWVSPTTGYIQDKKMEEKKGKRLNISAMPWCVTLFSHKCSGVKSTMSPSEMWWRKSMKCKVKYLISTELKCTILYINTTVCVDRRDWEHTRVYSKTSTSHERTKQEVFYL